MVVAGVAYGLLMIAAGIYLALDAHGLGWEYWRSPGLRPGLRAAARIRRGWRRLAVDLGLCVRRAPDIGVALRDATRGRARHDRVHIPRIVDVVPRRWGVDVQLHVGPTPGVGLAEFREAIPALQDAWRMVRVAVDQQDPARLSIRAITEDPLRRVVVSPLLDRVTAARLRAAVAGKPVEGFTAEANAQRLDKKVALICERARPTVASGALSCYDDILIGRTEFGARLTINLAADHHFVLGGTTRAGKSITTNIIVAHAMLMRDVQVVLIDPAGAATPPWKGALPAHLLCDTRDGDRAVRVLEEVMAEVERRQSLLEQLHDDKITDFSPELPLWLVIIDEASNYRKHAKFGELLENVATQALKYGIHLVLIVQKPSAENIPTGARSQLSGRITHRVLDPADYRHLFPHASQFAATITDEAATPQGVGIAAVPSHKAPCRFRSVWLPTQACFAIAATITASRTLPRIPTFDSNSRVSSSAYVEGEQHGDVNNVVTFRQAATTEIAGVDPLPGICALPGCDQKVQQVKGGRARKYCTDAHRIKHHRLRKHASN